MKKVPCPCERCKINETNPKCHIECMKYKAYVSINGEVRRRIGKHMKFGRIDYKPAVRTFLARK